MYKVIMWYIESLTINRQLNTIEKKVIIEEVIEDNEEEIEIIEPPKETLKSNIYYDYIKMNLIDVDLINLKKMNNDTVGWIQVLGTNINYPFVHTSNNDFYLNHDFNKKYNSAGWLFVDYRNNIEEFDKNTIIYGHGRLDKTMFGSLKNTLKNKWYNDTNNHIIKISTENENSLWQIFSIYTIKTTSDYLEIDFSDDIMYESFLNQLKNRSKLNFDTTVSPTDKIITLSTCYNKTDKLVVHAKLIKKTN